MDSNVFEINVRTYFGSIQEEEIILEGIDFIAKYIELFKERLKYDATSSFTYYEFCKGPYAIFGNKKIQFEHTTQEIKILYTDFNKNRYQELIDILEISSNYTTLESIQYKRKLSMELIDAYLIKII